MLGKITQGSPAADMGEERKFVENACKESRNANCADNSSEAASCQVMKLRRDNTKGNIRDDHSSENGLIISPFV